MNEALNGTVPWYDASGPHDPETVWYQGAYQTSQPYISTGRLGSEAYMQLAGYHFTVPGSWHGKFTAANILFENMGATFAYGPAIDGQAANKNIKQADYGWDGGFPMYFHTNTTETCNYHLTTIMTQWGSYAFDISQEGAQGDFRGSRDLWTLGGGAGTVDGRIPTLTVPVVETIDMSTAAAQFADLKSKNHLWVVPMPHPSWTPGPYRPNSGYGGTGRNNYWACASVRDVKLQLVIDG